MAAAMLALAAAPPAMAANSIFWPNLNGPISFASLGGGGGNLAEPALNPSGIAVDPATNTMYWVNGNAVNGGIPFFNLTTGSTGTLSIGSATVNKVFGLAVDPVANRIYWANQNSPSISFANLDGSGGGELATGSAPLQRPAAVAIDPAANRIYWVEQQAGTISYTSLDDTGSGGNISLFPPAMDMPAGIAIDAAAGKIYWVNRGNSIYSSDLNGDAASVVNVTPPGSVVNCPVGIALDPAQSRMYWANQCVPGIIRAGIWAANLNGSDPAQVNTTGATVANPEFPILLGAPVGSFIPAIAASSGLPQTLTCSRGTWASDLVGSFLYQAPASLSYSWADNGVPIQGATTPSISAKSAGSYACAVTATNFAGSTQQTSAPYVIAPVQPTPTTTTPVPVVSGPSGGGGGPAPAATMSLTRFVVEGPTATMPVSCQGVSGQTCVESVVGTVRERKRGSAILAVIAATRHSKPKVSTVTATVAQASSSVPAGSGGTARLTVSLNKLGRQLLARFVSLPVRLALSGAIAVTRTVEFTLPLLRVSIPTDNWGFLPPPCTGCYTKARYVPIRGIPAKAVVTVSCHGPGCPFGRRSVAAHAGRLNVAVMLAGAQLLAGARVDVAIIAPGFIGEVVEYQIRAGALPVRSILCLPPGARAPVGCAHVTPRAGADAADRPWQRPISPARDRNLPRGWPVAVDFLAAPVSSRSGRSAFFAQAVSGWASSWPTPFVIPGPPVLGLVSGASGSRER
jgi:DNA-binding beta-propeller fold protein YncE